MKKTYLVGHGNLDVEEFIKLLKDNQIETLVDIRSVPYSKFASQFNRENLRIKLFEHGLKYVFMGEMLGGRHPGGFNKYMNSEQFNKGIFILKDGISSSTSAIMCSELDYTKCHRRFIGSRLIDEGFNVQAISKNEHPEIVAQQTLIGVLR